jgi:hypothetical protein
MKNFDWMVRALGASVPAELRSRGLTVYEAPEVPADRRVVNLVNGVIVEFAEAGEIPAAGFWPDIKEITSLAAKSVGPSASRAVLSRPFDAPSR